jgi:hypothetical protein
MADSTHAAAAGSPRALPAEQAEQVPTTLPDYSLPPTPPPELPELTAPMWPVVHGPPSFTGDYHTAIFSCYDMNRYDFFQYVHNIQDKHDIELKRILMYIMACPDYLIAYHHLGDHTETRVNVRQIHHVHVMYKIAPMLQTCDLPWGGVLTLCKPSKVIYPSGLFRYMNSRNLEIVVSDGECCPPAADADPYADSHLDLPPLTRQDVAPRHKRTYNEHVRVSELTDTELLEASNAMVAVKMARIERVLIARVKSAMFEVKELFNM